MAKKTSKVYGPLDHLKDPYIAVDTEGTGLNVPRLPSLLKHPRYPARPYIVSACDDEGREFYWETPVEPDRSVQWPAAIIAQIRAVLDAYPLIVFHHGLYDIPALQSIGVFPYRLTYLEHWSRFHDTLPAAHVANSDAPKGLKSLSIQFLEMLDSDEDILRQIVVECRDLARRYAAIPYSLFEPGPSEADDPAPDYWLFRHFGHETKTYQQLLRSKGIDDDLKADPLAYYAKRDAFRTSLLFGMFRRNLPNEQCPNNSTMADCTLWDHYLRERANLIATHRQQTTGVHVHREILTESRQEVEQKRRDAEAICEVIAAKYGCSPLKANVAFSPKRLQTLLFDKLNLPPIKKTKTGYSCDSDSLQALNDLNAAGYFNFRRGYKLKAIRDIGSLLPALQMYNVAKTASQYLASYDYFTITRSLWDDIDGVEQEENRILPGINPNGTGTLRVSHSAPNLGNVGKGDDKTEAQQLLKLRRVFGPPRGCCWYPMDYDQEEIRIVAVSANERTMQRLLAENGDVHLNTAVAIYGLPPEKITKAQRKAAKRVNFGTIYGMGNDRCSQITGVDDFRSVFFSAYPDLQRHMRELTSFASRNGYIWTLDGYRLYTPPDRPYASLDYEVQGSAGTVLKNAIVMLDSFLHDYPPPPHIARYFPTYWAYKDDPYFRRLRAQWPIHLLLQVHDELVFECLEDTPPILLKLLRDIMVESGNTIGVYTPVSVSMTDTTWHDATAFPLPEYSAPTRRHGKYPSLTSSLKGA